jgi:hypothetical protein
MKTLIEGLTEKVRVLKKGNHKIDLVVLKNDSESKGKSKESMDNSSDDITSFQYNHARRGDS